MDKIKNRKEQLTIAAFLESGYPWYPQIIDGHSNKTLNSQVCIASSLDYIRQRNVD